MKDTAGSLVSHIIQRVGEDDGTTALAEQISSAADDFLESRPELRSKYLIDQWIKQVLGPMVRHGFLATAIDCEY